MYTKKDLEACLPALGIEKNDNLLIHSSMKSIGGAEDGADGVLDVLSDYLCGSGNLALPSHSWRDMNESHNIFDPETEPSCVGILTELYRKRNGVLRSFHPTHSIAINGTLKDAFVSGEENIDTPCGKFGCWHKLLTMDFKIMFLGCSTSRNTYLHGVEEWCDIPNRLTDAYHTFYIKMPDSSLFERKMRRHYNKDGDISSHYDRIQPYMDDKGLSAKGKFGDADCVVQRAADIFRVTAELLDKNPDFFGF